MAYVESTTLHADELKVRYTYVRRFLLKFEIGVHPSVDDFEIAHLSNG